MMPTAARASPTDPTDVKKLVKFLRRRGDYETYICSFHDEFRRGVGRNAGAGKVSRRIRARAVRRCSMEGLRQLSWPIS